jgi:hypothetical protein
VDSVYDCPKPDRSSLHGTCKEEEVDDLFHETLEAFGLQETELMLYKPHAVFSDALRTPEPKRPSYVAEIASQLAATPTPTVDPLKQNKLVRKSAIKKKSAKGSKASFKRGKGTKRKAVTPADAAVPAAPADAAAPAAPADARGAEMYPIPADMPADCQPQTVRVGAHNYTVISRKVARLHTGARRT